MMSVRVNRQRQEGVKQIAKDVGSSESRLTRWIPRRGNPGVELYQSRCAGDRK